ncbi:MAG: hypothetical protein ACKODT_07105 [Fluviibacter sp.]
MKAHAVEIIIFSIWFLPTLLGTIAQLSADAKEMSDLRWESDYLDWISK